VPPLALALAGVLGGVLVAGRPRRRRLLLYPVVMLVVIAVMVVANHEGDLGRALDRTVLGVHGEGMLGLFGVIAGALIVVLTPARGP